MEHPLTIEQLASAEVSLAVASSLLYVEPDPAEVAAQVATDQFSDAPFGTEDPFMAAGLAAMARWCAATRTAVAVELGCDPGTVGEEELLASSVFIEAVGALRREWLRLFAGAGAPEASCLESFYVEPNSHMFGKCTLAVRSCYRRHGLQVENFRREPDDHLGLMLGFLSRLVAEELAAREAGDAATAEALAAEQEAFLVDHVLPWLAPWRHAAASHAASDYFRGAGDLVFGLACAFAERFGIRFDGETRTFKQRK